LGLEDDDDDDDLVHVDDQDEDYDNLTEGKADIHLCRESFVGSIQLAGVLVLVVQAHLLTVRQLSQLGDLLEAELVSGELVGEAGGSGGKLLGDVPHTIRKLIPVKSLHGSE